MYTRKLYEPENELRIVIPGYGIGPLSDYEPLDR